MKVHDRLVRERTMEKKIRIHFERSIPDAQNGLSSIEVKQRIRQGLVNGTSEIKTKSIPQIIRDNIVTFFNILNFILAGLIASVHSYKNLLFLGVTVCNTAIGIIQEIRAKKTIDGLSLITSPKAHVVRNGTEIEIPISKIVLDDVVVLASGSQIPADCILLNGNCETDESLLTGESDPIAKRCGDTLLSGSYLVGHVWNTSGGKTMQKKSRRVQNTTKRQIPKL